MTIEDGSTAIEKLGDRRKLMGIEPLEDNGYVVAQRREHLLVDLTQALGHWMEDLPPPVVGIRLTTQVARRLESRDCTGDRARRQARDRGQLAA